MMFANRLRAACALLATLAVLLAAPVQAQTGLDQIAAQAEADGATPAQATSLARAVAQALPPSQQATLAANDAATGDQFGFSVSISGETAVVGAPGVDFGTGRAYVFVRSGSAWTQQAQLGDGDSGDDFGFSVSVSGETAVVGAPGGGVLGAGAAYVFDRSGSTWTQQAELGPDDFDRGDRFGSSVSVSGETAVVGAPDNGDDGDELFRSGSAYVFVRSGSTWVRQAQLDANNARDDDRLGSSVSISGETAVVGAPGVDFGTGRAYVFVRSGSAWTQQAQLGDGDSGDDFGRSVSVSDETAVVGAPGAFGTGRAYVFVRSGSSWTEEAQFTADGVGSDDEFGFSVAVSGRTAVFGAYQDDDAGDDSGLAYVYAGLGPPPTVSVGTAEGFYTLAAPGTSETVDSFFGPVWTQCFSGADYNTAPCGNGSFFENVFRYDEAAGGDIDQGYAAPASAADAIPAGTGRFVYLYADDDNDGTDDGFPKALPLTGEEPTKPFEYSLTYTDAAPTGTADNDGDSEPDDGWNLLGNPFREAFDWNVTYSGSPQDGSPETQNVDPTAYVYDPTNGYSSYNAATGTGTGVIAGGQIPAGYGFFVRANGPDPRLATPRGGVFRRALAATPFVEVRVSAAAVGGPLNGRELTGSALVGLHPDAAVGPDALDSRSLAPSGYAWVRLAALDGATDAPAAQAFRPVGSTEFDLALALAGVNAEAATVSWRLGLLDGMTAALVDRQSGTETAMTEGGTVAVDVSGASAALASGRFAVRLVTANAVATDDGPAAAAVSLVHPNPTTRTASVAVSVPSAERVRVSVYDALGRQVAVVHDGLVADRAQVTVGAGLAPGVYVIRVTGASFAESRSLTIVR